MESLVEQEQLTYAKRTIDYDAFEKMPEEYREQMIRIMSIQAYAEKKAATEGVEWIDKAPDYKCRRVFTNVLAEEAYHSYLIYKILENIRVSEEEAIDIAEGRSSGNKKMHDASLEGPLSVGEESNEWIDIMLNHVFLDRAGKFMVTNFIDASFTPWSEANETILKEEAGHIGFGMRELKKWLTKQTDREKTKEKISTWYAKGLNFFGPPSTHKSEMLKKFGIKRKDNEELRNMFIKEVEEEFAALNALDLIQLEKNDFPYRA
ncbi:Phenylacetic acid catabolic protein [Aliikangiella sp. IMCC44359]|uniref:Phenylacetic acid catabolic protein n=1 Tax=Aliikangiella sp. IMCC44359 TaxID=3459125 RepID=UPI00403AF953